MTKTLTKPTIVALIAVVSVAALLAGVLLATVVTDKNSSTLTLQNATLFPSGFRPLADFELSDEHGQVFNNHDLKGTWSLLFFGYSFCPDICPMTLHTLKQTHALLAEQKHPYPLQVVFVSVDPERDTIERLQQYVDYFNPSFIGITGKDQQLQTLSRSLGVFYTKNEPAEPNGYYLVDHSARLFLINPVGNPQALFSAPHIPQLIAQDIAQIQEYYE